MYVCICNAVTDKDILKAAENGARTLEDLSDELKVATCCGRCASCARGLLRQSCPAYTQTTQQFQVLSVA